VYTPAHFEASQPAFCHAVIRAFPFAPLVLGDHASHLPFLLDDARGELGTLLAHVARASPHADLVLAAAPPPALAIFTGPHGYISPTWYATGPAVPTWNYVAVHAHATPRSLDEPATRAYLDRLVGAHDPRWRFADQPADYQAKMVRGIVAFELPIARLEGKAKLSQNRSADDVARVIRELETTGSSELAKWMRDQRGQPPH
jgi:transcriptional regulator